MKPTLSALAAVALLACSSGAPRVVGEAGDASIGAADASSDAPPSPDGAAPIADGGADDAGLRGCTYDDGGSIFDGGDRFRGSCAGGCPPGTVCAVEIGGVAGGGGEYCAPILDRCKSDVSCACLASCLCGSSFGQTESCTESKTDGGEVLACDNGVR